MPKSLLILHYSLLHIFQTYLNALLFLLYQVNKKVNKIKLFTYCSRIFGIIIVIVYVLITRYKMFWDNLGYDLY